jgi:hypothetical protein
MEAAKCGRILHKEDRRNRRGRESKARVEGYMKQGSSVAVRFDSQQPGAELRRIVAAGRDLVDHWIDAGELVRSVPRAEDARAFRCVPRMISLKI